VLVSAREQKDKGGSVGEERKQETGGGGVCGGPTCKFAVYQITLAQMELLLVGCSFAQLAQLTVAFHPSQHSQLVREWVTVNFRSPQLRQMSISQVNNLLTGCPAGLMAEVTQLWLTERGLVGQRPT
jgi:hypothetical protein